MIIKDCLKYTYRKDPDKSKMEIMFIVNCKWLIQIYKIRSTCMVIKNKVSFYKLLNSLAKQETQGP